MNKEESEDGALGSRIQRSFLTILAVIDLTGPDSGNGNRPLICAAFTANLLPGDKGNKGKQPLDTYMQFKGRGRYKLAKCVCFSRSGLPIPLTFIFRSQSETINAAFEVNPEENEGLNYAYDTVVRNKEERRKMHGSDCECCKEVGFQFTAPRSALTCCNRSTIAQSGRCLPASKHLFGVPLPPLRNSKQSCSHHP